MSDSTSLFDDFAPITKADWLAKVTQDLKGADYHEKMVWETPDGFSMEALYMPEDMEKIRWVQSFENAFYNPEKAHLQTRYWQNCPTLTVDISKTSNAHALEALQNGADAVQFKLGETEVNFEALLNDVLLPYCGVYFQSEANLLANCKAYFAFAQSKQYELATIEGGWFAGGQPHELAETIRMAEAAPHFKVLGIAAPDAPTISTRIANLLWQTAQHIDSLETHAITPTQVFQNLYVHLSVSSAYFPEIAGLRALRILLSQMARLFAVEIPPYAFRIHAFTTLDKHEEDAYQYMLSNTTQAMSAIVGNADVLTVLPHTLYTEPNNRFALRIARNVSSILKEEGHLDKVADPAAGSYYLEMLTAKLAESAWQQFQQRLSS